MTESIQSAIIDLNEDHVIHLVSERMKAGESPEGIVEALSHGMATITDRFEKGEYGLAELNMATEIFDGCAKMLEPKMKEASARMQGTIVLGKVKGRHPDFSQAPVAGMLRAAGFEVHDLGKDNSSERFVQKVKEVNADIIAICGLETDAVGSAKETISDIRKAGITAKILVGAGMLCGCSIAIDDKIRQTVGADASWNSIREAVDLAKKAMAEEA